MACVLTSGEAGVTLAAADERKKMSAYKREGADGGRVHDDHAGFGGRVFGDVRIYAGTITAPVYRGGQKDTHGVLLKLNCLQGDRK